MSLEAGKVYVFGEFRLEAGKRILMRGDEPIRLANRPFQVLLYLIENRQRLVSRDELLEKFWDGREVYDTALTKAVGAVRQGLRESCDEPRFIETRWAEGYRFIGEIEAAPVYLEFERTREVKFVIEEESGPLPAADDSAADDAPASLRETNPVVLRKSSPHHKATEVSDLNLQTNKTPAGSEIPRWRYLTAAGALLILIAIYWLTRSQTQTQVAFTNQLAPVRSIAVLPLKNLSSSPNGEIFTDGMTESLISSLSKIKGLKVISRNSVFVFKDKVAPPQEIAEKLGVEAFLEGSVRVDGERIRVEIRLVNALDGQILWSGDNYERRFGDVFEIQDDIARRVATRFRLELSESEERHLTKRQTERADAYQAFVKGRYFWKRKNRENLEKARRFFEEAIRLDPKYALAYAGLADYYLSGVWYADLAPDEALKNAKAAVQKISEIDDQLPEAHKLRATIAGLEWDWETLRRETEKAIELNPNEADYWHTYAFVLRNVAGQNDEAVAAIKRAQQLDPLSISIHTDVGVMLRDAGRYDEAIKSLRETLEIEPQFFDAYWNLGLAYERNGQLAEAVAAFIESERLKGMSSEKTTALREAFEKSGMKGFWRQWLEFLQQESQTKPVYAGILASFQARVGEREAAFENLEKAFAAREPFLVNLKSEVAFDALRSDPRFADLLKRVGFDR